MPAVFIHTCPPAGLAYPPEVAGSIHLTLEDGPSSVPLNRGYGILFPEGNIAPDNTIRPRFLTAPRADFAGGLWTLMAPDAGDPGLLHRWESRDLMHFVSLPDDREDPALRERYDRASCRLPVEEGLARRLVRYWNGPEEAAPRRFPFPLAEGFADPVVFPWQGRWLFAATNDNTDDIGLYLRRADTVEGLFAPGAEQSLVLDRDEEKGYLQTFWAPEFHCIGGRLYLLFALTRSGWRPQCHYMQLKPGADPLDPSGWEPPVLMLPDREGITLDMTHFTAGGADYLVWSERYHIGTPLDSGSMLYIARTDPARPEHLLTEPVLLSRPLFGWENQSGTINNEGPFALLRNGKVYLSYAAGAAGGISYTTGFLIADEGADLCDPAAWEKLPRPVLHFRTDPGEEGPGHAGFFEDGGETYITYHAQRPGDRQRCTAIREVVFREDGMPGV